MPMTLTREDVEKMPRKEINTEVWHLVREQEEYAEEAQELRRQLDAAHAQIAALRDPVEDFVAKVESGRAKSRDTYAKFKAALSGGNDWLHEKTEAACDAVEEALIRYRCEYTVDSDDEWNYNNLPLADKLTPPDQETTELGKRELELLVDRVCGDMIDVLDPGGEYYPKQQKGGVNGEGE